MAIRPYQPKADIRPYYPSVLDIETEGVTGSEIGVGFAWQDEHGDRQYLEVETWQEFFDYYRDIYKAADKDTRYRLRTIYAHYGAGFDWLHLAAWARDKSALVTVKSYQSGTIVHGLDMAMRIDGERFTLRLRDSFRLLPASLADLCRTFTVDNRKLELSGELPEALKKRDPKRFWLYLRQDVFALGDVLKRFWELLYSAVGSIDRLPLTLPALAMRLFRLQLKEAIYTPWQKDLKELERLAYVGGRTESFGPGEYDVRVYDVNSEYPAVMAAGVFPVSYVGGWTDNYLGEHGLYHVRFKQTNRARLPLLPCKDDAGGVYFPYEGEGVYTKPELDKLLEVGGELEVIKGYVFYEMGNPFAGFVEHWYGVRRQAQERGDEGLAFVCKILLNSLYGKFGQMEEGWAIAVWDSETYEKRLEDGTEFRDYGDCVMVKESKPNETTFVGMAAYVTAQARLLLYAYMCQAQDAGGRVVYVDTDSVHMVDGEELETGTGLGRLKLEYEGGAIYAGKKLYTLTSTGKVKAKGIGKSAARNLTAEDFRNMVYNGASIEVQFSSFPTALEVFSGIRRPAVMIRRTRTLRATYKPPNAATGD